MARSSERAGPATPAGVPISGSGAAITVSRYVITRPATVHAGRGSRISATSSAPAAAAMTSGPSSNTPTDATAHVPAARPTYASSGDAAGPPDAARDIRAGNWVTPPPGAVR